MEADTVTADDAVIEEPVVEETPTEEVQEHEEAREEKSVPLSALQKERKKRQEAELKSQWNEQKLQEFMSKPKEQPPEEDDSQYEAVTKGDLKNYSKMEREDIIRTIKEDDWVKNHPERAGMIDEKLPELLKKKPHVSYAIMYSKNRYEEAWDQLMGQEKVNTPQRAAARKEVKAPLSPANMPKSAGVSQTIDVMGMSDAEFNAWRKQHKGRRS